MMNSATEIPSMHSGTYNIKHVRTEKSLTIFALLWTEILAYVVF